MAGHLETSVAQHYSGGGLYDRILAALAANGIAEGDMRAEHLRAVDEFHIGGAPATERLLDPLKLGPGARALDIGSGLGGAARHIVRSYGAEVTGIDLTPDYVETARRISDRLGVKASFVVGSALDLPFDDNSFDVATLLHVGMNLPDKQRLFAEVARVLRPGGAFAVYDVMLFGRHPAFPVPWSSEPATSFLAAPEVYLAAAEAAGFALEHRASRGEVAKAFFAEMQRRMAEDGPPVVGLPILMGETTARKVENMVAAVHAGDIAPVEMVFRRPS